MSHSYKSAESESEPHLATVLCVGTFGGCHLGVECGAESRVAVAFLVEDAGLAHHGTSPAFFESEPGLIHMDQSQKEKHSGQVARTDVLRKRTAVETLGPRSYYVKVWSKGSGPGLLTSDSGLGVRTRVPTGTLDPSPAAWLGSQSRFFTHGPIP